MTRMLLSDTTLWPVPDTGSDRPLAWVLRYGEPRKADLARAAQIIEAYEYLLLTANRTKRELVAREVKQFIRGDTQTSIPAPGVAAPSSRSPESAAPQGDERAGMEPSTWDAQGGER